MDKSERRPSTGLATIVTAATVVPVERPVQKDGPYLPELTDLDQLVRVPETRRDFNVSGSGVTVAILDTGLRATHADFSGRVLAGHNCTGGDPDDTGDRYGHGTSVGGIACAGRIHTGVAPNARIVPVKVLGDDGGGTLAHVRDGLEWVLGHWAQLGISALCMPFGTADNRTSDTDLAGDEIGSLLQQLTERGVACVVGSGNEYYAHGGVQGMSYPAIIRHCLSVGAVYDADEGPFRYPDGAKAFSTAPDRITPYSQRLHHKIGGPCATDLFAPGSPVTSTGVRNDTGESLQYGTSRAAAVTTGVILLLQSYYLRATGELPTVADVKRWLLRGATVIYDGDDEHDNVAHTGLTFSRLSAPGALFACAKELAMHELTSAQRM
ncbi:S8 family peptidase [Rhodococcus sp. NPDC003348]